MIRLGATLVSARAPAKLLARANLQNGPEDRRMAESVYKVIEIIGTSTDSWDKAAKAAVERAASTLRDLRIAEVLEQDIQIKDGKVELYRVKLKLSFKFEGE
jgi:flavin-binding protein dodecin